VGSFRTFDASGALRIVVFRTFDASGAQLGSPDKARVGLRTARNDRRRSFERVLVLLADPELKSYLAEVRVRLEDVD